MRPAEFGIDRRLGLVLGLAFLWRAVYLLDFSSLPFWDGPMFDSVVYLRQATSVSRGRHGDASLLAMSPLYGYFVAALGSSARLVAFAQLCLGLVSIGIAGRIGERLAAGFGWIAAAAVATYGMFSFYETKVMSDVLGMTLLLASLDWFLLGEEGGFTRHGLGSGVVLGLATLSRASLVPCLPLLVISSFAMPRSSRARFGASFSAGLVVVLVGHGAVTYAAVGRFVPVILTSKTFATMSQHAWDGRLRASDGSDSRPSAWDVVEQAQTELDHPATESGASIDWTGVLRGAPAKLLRTFSNTERGFDYPFYGERELLPSFRILPGSFGALMTLGVVGAVVGRRKWRLLLPLGAIALGTLATIVVTHPSSRYRLPLALVLALLAPITVEFLTTAISSRRRSVAGIVVLGVVVSTAAHLFHVRSNPASLQRILATSYGVAGDIERAAFYGRRAEVLELSDSEN